MAHESIHNFLPVIDTCGRFVNMHPFLLQILHSHIASVEKLPLNAAGSPLKIRCKTFQIVTFIISRDRDSQEIYSSLLQLSSPGLLVFCQTN